MTEAQLGAAMLNLALSEGHTKGLPRNDKGNNITRSTKEVRQLILDHIREQPGLTRTRLNEVIRSHRNHLTDILARCVADGDLVLAEPRRGVRAYFPAEKVA